MVVLVVLMWIVGFILGISLLVTIFRRFNCIIDYRKFIYEDDKIYYFRINKSKGDDDNHRIRIFSKKIIWYELCESHIKDYNIDTYHVTHKLDDMMQTYIKDKAQKEADIKKKYNKLDDFEGWVGNVSSETKKKHTRNKSLDKLGV